MFFTVVLYPLWVMYESPYFSINYPLVCFACADKLGIFVLVIRRHYLYNKEIRPLSVVANMVFPPVCVSPVILLIIFNADIFDSLWLLRFVTHSVIRCLLLCNELFQNNGSHFTIISCGSGHWLDSARASFQALACGQRLVGLESLLCLLISADCQLGPRLGLLVWTSTQDLCLWPGLPASLEPGLQA